MDDREKINNNELTFEDFKKENGISYWWASDVMKMLDYKEMNSFKKAKGNRW